MAHVQKCLLRGIVLLVCTAVIGWTGSVRGAVLTPDPDFGLQTEYGNPITSPWGPVAPSPPQLTLAASAQSPFTEVFADNAKGATTAATGGNPHIVGTFSPAISASATGLLYFNADFRNNSSETGGYSMEITNASAAAQRSAALYITGNALYADSSSGPGSAVTSLSPDTWYNVRLTLDLTHKTYSGTVTPYGGTSTAIAERSFVNTANPIGCIFTDGGSDPFGGTAPAHDIDNFALSTTSPNAQIVNIDFNGVRNVPGPDVPGPTYSGAGAAGGGNVFNGILADSRLTYPNDDDNLTVGAVNLLDSYGALTSAAFTVSPVGGDVGGTPTTDPTSYEALFSDYVFDHSAGNNSDSPFVISGLLGTQADLYFYFTNGADKVTVDGAAPGTLVPSSIFNSGNTVYFPMVPIVNGQITGHFGNGTAVIEGLTIVAEVGVPEPAAGTLLLTALIGLPLLCRRRTRAAKAARAGA